MPINTNRWNRLRYTLWAPVYDIVGRVFDRERGESLRTLNPRPGETILIVGAGTGADFQHLPSGTRVTATDLTPAMLERARSRAREGIYLAVMDGHQLGVRTASVDAVVLHLILAVIPDPVRCLQEAARVLRPGGRIVVFDKFVRGRRAPTVLRVLNIVINTLFTDVTRNFEEILQRSGTPLTVEQERASVFGRLYRHLLLRKNGRDGGLV